MVRIVNVRSNGMLRQQFTSFPRYICLLFYANTRKAEFTLITLFEYILELLILWSELYQKYQTIFRV